MSAPRLKDLAEKVKDCFVLPTHIIRPSAGWNVRQRFDTPEDDSLYHYILGGGKLPPVLGYRDGSEFVLVDGERRWRQCVRACESHGLTDAEGKPTPWATMECLAEDRGSSEPDRIVRMVASNNGKALTIAEQAEAFSRYRLSARSEGLAVTSEAMAHRFGCTRTHIEDALLLHDGACPDLRAAVANERIAATLAIKLIRRCDGHDEQATLLSLADRNARSAEADRITEKHFGDTLAERKKPKGTRTAKPSPAAQPPADPPKAPTITPQPGYGYDSSRDGEYEQDITRETDEEGESDGPADDPTCVQCGAVLSVSDRGRPSGCCYRCAPTKEVQPDDTGSGASTTHPRPAATTGSSSGGGGRGGRELPSSGGGRDTPPAYEPPITLDAAWLQGILDDAKAPNLTSDPRRLTIGYLRSFLTGDLSRAQIVAWVKTGQVE